MRRSKYTMTDEEFIATWNKLEWGDTCRWAKSLGVTHTALTLRARRLRRKGHKLQMLKKHAMNQQDAEYLIDSGSGAMGLADFQHLISLR